jgi:hypothetical protein
VAFNPDGNSLASVDEHGTMRWWDPVTGDPLPIRCRPAWWLWGR